MENSRCVFHTEGDMGDVLFVLPAASRQLREGDMVTHTSLTDTIRYKIETVDYHVEEGRRQGILSTRDYWKTPVTYFGVSVVV